MEGLIKKAKNGNKSSILELIHLFRPLIHSYVNTEKNKSLRQDLKSVLIIAFIEGTQCCKDKEINFFPGYIRSCLLSALKRYRKKEQRAREIKEKAMHYAGEPCYIVPDPCIQKEQRSTLIKKLRTLPGREQRVLYAKLVEGLTWKEISTQIGCPLSTIYSRYRRALRKLNNSDKQPLSNNNMI